MNEKLVEISSDIKTLNECKERFSTIEKEFETIKEENTIKNKNITEYKTEVKNVSEVIIPNMRNELTAAIIKDSKERNMIKSNIIIYGLKDSNKPITQI